MPSTKLAKNIAWKFGERFLAQAISFVVSLVLARVLTPQDYGATSIILIFIVFADVLIQSGFSTALIQKKNADKIDFSTIFYCSLAASIILYIVLFALAPYIANFYHIPELVAMMRVFCIRLPIGSYNSIQHAYVSRHMQFKKFFFSTLFGTLLSGIIGVFLALHGFGAWAIIWQYLSNSIIDTIVLSLTINWHPELLFSKKSARKLMSYGWKVLVADFSGAFFDQLRALIIGRQYTTTDLAYYNRGKQLPDILITNLSTSIMSVLFPELSNRSEDKKNITSLTRTATRIISYITFPICIGLAVTAPTLVPLLFSEAWNNSIFFLQILSISSGFSLVGAISIQTIKAVGRSDLLLKLEFYKKPIYILLLLIGVKISVPATAITMLIYSIYGSAVNAFSLKRILSYSYTEQLYDIAPSIMNSIIMGIVVYSLNFIAMPPITLIILQTLTGLALYITISTFNNKQSTIYIKEVLIKWRRAK